MTLDLSLFYPFLFAATVLAITPGLDTALVLRAAIQYQSRIAFAVALGVVMGCLFWGTLVALGLGALLTSSGTLFVFLKTAGAIYLISLGLFYLFKPRSGMVESVSVEQPNAWKLFRQGFLTNLLNPKVGLFYISFLPQFVPAGSPLSSTIFILALIHSLLSLTWFLIIMLTTNQISVWVKKPSIMKMIDRVTGSILMFFGIKLGLLKSI